MGAKLLKKEELVLVFDFFFVLLWRIYKNKPMLYLEIEPNALHFILIEGEEIQHSVYEMQHTLTFESNLRNAISGIPQTNGGDEPLRVLMCSPGTTMSLGDFSEEVAPNVFHYCLPGREKEEVMYDMVPEANAVWLFGIPKDQMQTLEHLFGTVFYASTMAPLARYTMKQTRAGERKIMVNCRHGWIDVVAVRGRYLELANTFQVNSPTDTAFYVMSIVKRIGFNQTKDECLLTGEEGFRNAAHTELARFISHLEHRVDISRELLSYLH